MIMKKEIKELIVKKQERIIKLNKLIDKEKIWYAEHTERLLLERNQLLEEIRMLHYKNK